MSDPSTRFGLAGPHRVGRTRAVALSHACVLILAVGFMSSSCVTTRSTRAPVDRDARVSAPVMPDRPPRGVDLPAEPEIRVRIHRGAERIAIDGPGAVRLRSGDAGEVVVVDSARPVALSIRGGAFIAEGGGATHSFTTDLPLHVQSDGTTPLRIDNVTHPGAVELHRRSQDSPTSFDVIERVGIETYLPGVLSKELYPNWSLEAYKTQAIAARTYALHERERRMSNGSHFDIENTEMDQVYGGLSARRVALDAARETRGLVLTHRGELLRAYYSSTCGERPGSARDTWPTGPGFEFNLALPLQARERECACSISPRHRWSVTRQRDELAARFVAYGRANGLPIRNLQGLDRIQPSRFNAAGRPAEYRVVDARGNAFTLSAEGLRLACNVAVGTRYPAADGAQRVLSGDLEFTFRGAEVEISGRGFGHGVGMCQFGAEGFARQGRTPSEILLDFYPGARIERAY